MIGLIPPFSETETMRKKGDESSRAHFTGHSPLEQQREGEKEREREREREGGSSETNVRSSARTLERLSIGQVATRTSGIDCATYAQTLSGSPSNIQQGYRGK